MGKKVQFFKILIGDFSEKLHIPRKVVNFLSDKASKRAVVLQGPIGCIWHIKLGNATNGWYIMDGWSDFVNDHSLKESDLLFFKYDGIMHFKVKIFDQSACEKNILSPKVQKRKPERPTKHQAEVGGDVCDDLLGDEDAFWEMLVRSPYVAKGQRNNAVHQKTLWSMVVFMSMKLALIVCYKVTFFMPL
ncbi:B3 domain-containing protein [Acorus gramineus]|uniref:B3 domain-containing protein n=1 Tax=Acorus gramineus TaxID=55184 RepID=A0AAV9A6U9_ACOGR|nr:B3 domain-containing protein [Acorus gramineus]